jgi:thiol-disulfide isomerase/thioredoxin
MRLAWRMTSILSLSVFLFIVGCVGQGSRHVSAKVIGELKESQKFTLTDLNGQSVSLDQLLKEKKAVLINFWATWCPPCREEIPDLIKLQEKYKDSAFTILGVDVGESQKKVSGFAEKEGINYPIVLDSDMKVSESFSVYGIPTSYLVSSGGKILGEYHAFTSQLAADVDEALK